MSAIAPANEKPPGPTAAPAPRVGVLTLHYGYNYGAILQALATARLFRGVILDYRYRSKVEFYRSKLKRSSDHLERYIDNELPLSLRRLVLEHFEEAPVRRDIRAQGLELLVFGSDELWKTRYRASSPRRQVARALARNPYRAVVDHAGIQVNPWDTPFPNIYWPLKGLGATCVGFAGSVGSATVAGVPANHQRKMAERLGRFELLGVRDRHTEAFFREISPTVADRIQRMPDPVWTFTVDETTRGSAMRVLADHGVDPGLPYVFAHLTNRNRRKEPAVEDAFRDRQVADLLAMPLTPPEWFAAIGGAEAGVTDAMHPLVSSLVQNTPCLSLDRRNKSAEIREEFGLSHHKSLDDAIATWPEDVPRRAAAHAERVRAFVQQALALAKRPAA